MDTNPLNIKGQTSDSGGTGQVPVDFSMPANPPVVPIKPPVSTPAVFVSNTQTDTQTTPITNPVPDSAQISDVENKKRAAIMAMESDAAKKRREDKERVESDAENKRLSLISEEEKDRLGNDRIEKEKTESENKAKDDVLKKSISLKREIEDIKKISDKTLNVRTLKDDMEQLVKEQDISSANIALQEDRKKQATAAVEKKEGKKNWVIIIISSVFIISGLGIIGWYLYSTGNFPGFSSAPTTQTSEGIVSTKKESPIYSDSQKELDITGLKEDKILSAITKEINNSSTQIGKIEELLIINKETGVSIPVKLDSFLSLTKSEAPADLLRTLNQYFNFQIYASIKSTATLILETDSFQKAFAGMLAWEILMPKDLYRLISGQKYDPEVITGKFEDFTYKNMDARIIRDRNGEIALVYSFLDNKTIVITGNEIAFDEIIARFNSPKAVAK